MYPNVVIGDNVTISAQCIIGKIPQTGRNQAKILECTEKTIIGNGVFIGDQTIIYSNVKIGNDCYLADRAFIRENVTIENDVVIGTSTVIAFNAQIGAETKIMTGTNIAGNSKIGKHCFIGLHVCSVNDNNPLDPTHTDRKLMIGSQIGDNVVIGSNTTLLPAVKINNNIVVGAASIVTKDLTQENSLYMGSPAKFVRSNN